MFRNLKLITAAVLFALATGPAFADDEDDDDQLPGILNNLQSNIDAEAAARGAADAALQGNIDAEAAARAAADAAEAAARQVGDTALQNQIDAVSDTNASTICAPGNILTGDGSCVPLPVDTDTSAADCPSGQILTGDDSCVPLPVDTDTSAADCPSGQILVSDGNGGTCVDLPTTTDPGVAPVCPAFNAAMVDAAALGANLINVPPPLELADDPAEPKITCRIETLGGDGSFLVVVQLLPNPGFAGVNSLVESPPGTPFQQFSSTRGDLSREEFDACRAQVLLSFVWNQYCAPFLP